MMTSAHQLIPRDKFDVETVRLASRSGLPAVEPVLYELLEWIRDGNWPVAGVLFPFLASIGEPLAPHIRRAFASGDYTWQYWICELFWKSPALYSIFRQDIRRIALSPSPDEHHEGLDERCAELIAHYDSRDA